MSRGCVRCNQSEHLHPVGNLSGGSYCLHYVRPAPLLLRGLVRVLGGRGAR